MSVFEMLNSQGNTLIVVTHDEAVAAHAGRRVRLRDGMVESDSAHPAGAESTDPQMPSGDPE